MKRPSLLLVAVTLPVAVVTSLYGRAQTQTQVPSPSPARSEERVDSRQDQAQQSQQGSAARVMELKAADGTVLKASYFAAGKPGPGVLLLHQSNRTRKSWDDLAGQLAAAGINTLTL